MATSLSQEHEEDINFLRLTGLLIRVAPRAVRQRFDFEFHPEQLQQFLRTNRGKIYDLTYKKRITLAQYDVLYPKGSSEVSSDMFDVSLMVCLLRNFTDLDIQDSLPVANIHTVAADISRIKFYRNSIVHYGSCKMNEKIFSEIWNCVAEAILRLVPEIKSQIDALICSPLKMEMPEIEKKNIKEIQLRTLAEWRDTDKKYISTSATTFILQSLKHNRGVIITGSPGCGKSAAAHHVAFELEKEGYEILPCDDPSEIVKQFTTEKVFVIDDVCGKFSLNQQKADSWDLKDGKLNKLLESSNQNDDDEDNSSKQEAKFIITCRENIYVHNAFPKLTCFSLVQCSFSTEYKISAEEMRNIALSYIPINIVNDIQNICLYDFFPLLCSFYCKNTNKDPSFFIHPVKIIEYEISEMKRRSESSFLCISLLVLRNNKFCKDELKTKDVKQLVKAICWDCEIESFSIVAILNSFERLKGIYITESDNSYTAIHDKMFDIIAAAIAPSIIKCLIEHVDIAFLANRTKLASFSQSSIPFVIYIPQEFESLYLKRQSKEAMKGKYWEVFGSIQTEYDAYRKLLILILKEQDTCQQISYDAVEDGNTPLYVSSHLGYLDFVEYFVVKCPNHIDVKDKEGRSPFYVACEKGHIAVVEYLMKYNEDINAENVDKTTALSATCLNGHTEVAKLLLDNNADINISNTLNQDPLHFACLTGNLELVKLLLKHEYKVDITKRDTFGQTVLHTASQQGHTEIVETLIKCGMDVNLKNLNCRTPLYLACEHGCYDTVKLIIGFISSKQISTHRTVVDVLNRSHRTSNFTVLHSACYNGHTEVAKLLIDVGMNINDTSKKKSSSPLALACMGGHYDTVKCLLDLNNQTLRGRVDTTIKDINGWSALHGACSRGHTEVVKLLIDVGMHLNDTSYNSSTPLVLACQRGHFKTVKYLLDLNGITLNSRVDTTTKRKNGCSAIHTACINGHLEVVKLLAEVGVTINDTSSRAFTLLIQACEKGHNAIVQYLLDINGKQLKRRVYADIKPFCLEGYTALHIACYNGHRAIVELLIDVGINVNKTSKTDKTPLYLACEKGHYDTVKFLLDLNGQTVNSRVDTTIKDSNGWSALHAACFQGHTQIVKLLIDAGMNVHCTSQRGFTPLFQACWEGHYEIVKLLLQLNSQTINGRVDTSKKGSNGWSPLHGACFRGHAKVVKLLIDFGMNINDTTNSCSTPLYLACQEGYFEIAKYLTDLNGQRLDSRVDTTKKRKNGCSALHIACINGHIDVVKLLLDVGMNPNDTSNADTTPLYQACRNGHYEIVKYLLDLNGQTVNSCVDITMKDTDGWSVLHAACSNGHAEILMLLIEVGMHINERDHSEKTAVHLACINGHAEVVKILKDNCAELQAHDSDRHTPFMYAKEKGYSDIMKLFIEEASKDELHIVI